MTGPGGAGTGPEGAGTVLLGAGTGSGGTVELGQKLGSKLGACGHDNLYSKI